MKEKELTPLQKILIEYCAITGFNDWTAIYIYCHDIKPDQKIYSSRVSEFKNSKKVKDFFNLCQYRFVEDREKEIEKRIKEKETENGRTQTTETNSKTPVTEIDFTDRNQFIKYLNQAVNGLQDDKQKTDYLKMLSDLLRFKESETGQDNEIQRFYTPLTCQNCALYRQEQQK